MKSAAFRFFERIPWPLDMVDGTFSVSCLMRYCWFIGLVFFSALVAGAEKPTVELAPGLSVMLPESMAVRAYHEQSSDDSTILIGDLGGEPAYFLGGVKVERWERSNVLWTKLENKLRRIDPSDNLSVIARGGFITHAGSEVRYRGYRFRHKAAFRRQVYFLLRSESQIYWLTLTAVEGADLSVVIPLVQALIRRTRLTDQVRPGSDY